MLPNSALDIFWDNMRKYRYGLLAFAGTASIFILSFFLYGYNLRAIWYPLLLSVVLMSVILIISLRAAKKKADKIRQLSAHPGKDVETLLPEPKSNIEEAYNEVIKALCSEIAEKEREYDKKEQETRDYYSVWAHQIKTPIASMRLKLSSMDSQDARVLRQGLRGIETYVDMVMTYERLGSKTTDYLIKDVQIKKVVLETVKKFSIDFIERKLSLNIDIDDTDTVLSDSKWLSVIIEQLLSNAIKYTVAGSISISFSKENNSLSICDTGIGIDEENIPRIFDKGFTGFNGRGDNHSSGLGLYVSKIISEKLGISLKCESEVSKGTVMTLVFPKKDMEIE